jgi:hypothetical protein
LQVFYVSIRLANEPADFAQRTVGGKVFAKLFATFLPRGKQLLKT